jgi:hypothetical protein
VVITKKKGHVNLPVARSNFTKGKKSSRSGICLKGIPNANNNNIKEATSAGNKIDDFLMKLNVFSFLLLLISLMEMIMKAIKKTTVPIPI